MEAGLGGGSSRCGGSAARVRAAVGGRAGHPAARSCGGDRLRRPVLSVRRHRARSRPRRGDLSARRPAGPLGRHRPARVRRVDGRGLHLVRRGPRRRAEGTARAAGPARALAVPRRADDQRPRAAGRPAASRDHRLSRPVKDGGAVAAAMSGSGSAVFGLFRTADAAAADAATARARRRADAADPHADPRRARTPEPSGCQKGVVAAKLILLRTLVGPRRRSSGELQIPRISD